jgi:hypothetical protein
MKKYYEDEKLSISFDPEKQGYWIVYKTKSEEYSNFVDQRSFQDFQNSDILDLLQKLDAYNEAIRFNLSRAEIPIKKLEKALEQVKIKEGIELHKFKQANNL